MKKNSFGLAAALMSLVAGSLPGFAASTADTQAGRTRSTPRTRPYNAPKRDHQRDIEVMEHNARIDAQKAEKRARKAARA